MANEVCSNDVWPIANWCLLSDEVLAQMVFGQSSNGKWEMTNGKCQMVFGQMANEVWSIVNWCLAKWQMRFGQSARTKSSVNCQLVFGLGRSPRSNEI